MDFKKTAISGVKWTTLSTLVTASVAVLRLSVLTRFLNKEDFGIVAILTLVLGLTQTFADLGFSSAIMHRQDLSRRDFSSLYWIQLIVFASIYVLVSLFSGAIANFYDASSLSYLLPLALLDLLFYGIGRLYDTILQKEFLFKVIAVRNVVCSLVSLVVAVLLAVWGFGIYSLVLSTLFQTLTNNVWNAVAGQKYYKIQWVMSVKRVMPLMKIGIYQTGTQIVDYFSAKFDILIIGKLLGAEALGIYSLAKELVMRVVILINTIGNKVILPYFSLLQNSDDALRRNYCKIIQFLSFVNFPATMLIGLLSSCIVATFYGNSYIEAVPIVSILSIWSIFICIGNPVGNISIAKGRTDLSFKYVLVRILLTIPIVWITSSVSIECVAWGQVLMALVLFVIGYRMLLYKLIKLSFYDFIASFYRIALLVLVVSLCLYYPINTNILSIDSNIGQLIIYMLIIIIIYVGLLWLLFRNMLQEIIKMLK